MRALPPPSDQDWLEGLFDLHATAIRGYALRRLPAHAADDVVAEVFVVAWRRRPRPRARPRLRGVRLRRRCAADGQVVGEQDAFTANEGAGPRLDLQTLTSRELVDDVPADVRADAERLECVVEADGGVSCETR